MLAALKRYEFRVAVGVHGAIYGQTPNSFFDRKIIHYRRELGMDFPVSLLGTGTAAFDVRSVPFSLDDAPTGGMADIWFARFLKEHGIPAICVRRKRDWLTDWEQNDADNLYSKTKSQPTAHTAEIVAGNPWGFADLRGRIAGIENRRLLDPTVATLINAAAVLERSETSERFLFNRRDWRHKRPFLSAAPLIPVVCDRNTAIRIYAHFLEHKPQHQVAADVALAGLAELDPSAVDAVPDDRLVSIMPDAAFARVVKVLRSSFRHEDALRLIEKRRTAADQPLEFVHRISGNRELFTSLETMAPSTEKAPVSKTSLPCT